MSQRPRRARSPHASATPSGPAVRRQPPPTTTNRSWRRSALPGTAFVVIILVVLGAGYVLASSASPGATPAPSVGASGSSPSSTGPAGASPAASLAAAASSAVSLPGTNTGDPPWDPETANLRARLDAIGLPALAAEGTALHIHAHLDIFVDGAAVPVPAGIGINETQGFIAPLHTHDATGIIHVESPEVRDFTLGQFFDIWGVQFDAHCVGGACDGNGRTLQVFVNGKLVTGDPRAIKLAAHQEVVVAVGSAAQLPNPVPSSFDFPPGL